MKPSTLLGRPMTQAQADAYVRYARFLSERNAEALKLWRGERFVRRQIGGYTVVMGK